MKSLVRPELPAAVDNSAPRSTHPESTYKSGKPAQTTGTTSFKDDLEHPSEGRAGGCILRNDLIVSGLSRLKIWARNGSKSE